jgi:hypothetical protein
MSEPAPPPAGEREDDDPGLLETLRYITECDDGYVRDIARAAIAKYEQRASRSSTPGSPTLQVLTYLNHRLSLAELNEVARLLGSTPESGTEPPCDHGTKRPGPDDWKYLDSQVHGAAGVRVCRVCGVKQAQKWVDVAALAADGGRPSEPSSEGLEAAHEAYANADGESRMLAAIRAYLAVDFGRGRVAVEPSQPTAGEIAVAFVALEVCAAIQDECQGGDGSAALRRVAAWLRVAAEKGRES